MTAKLAWGWVGDYWLAFTGPDIRSATLHVYSDRVEIRCGAETTRWTRASHGLVDDVDAMIFAEHRARELCAKMFGDLVGGECFPVKARESGRKP